jgi:hypothetical protein
MWIKARKSKCPIGCPRNRNVSFRLQSCWTVAEGLSGVKARRSGRIAQRIKGFPQESPRKARNDFRAGDPCSAAKVGKLSKKELYDEINAKAAVSKAAE